MTEQLRVGQVRELTAEVVSSDNDAVPLPVGNRYEVMGFKSRKSAGDVSVEDVLLRRYPKGRSFYVNAAWVWSASELLELEVATDE